MSDESVAGQLEELRQQVDDEDFESVVTLCQELLKSNDDNESVKKIVFEIYVKALLHQKQFEQVLGLSPPVSTATAFLKVHQAYASYRLEQYQKAIQNTNNPASEEDDPLAVHINAQALFHLSQTESALKAYQGLMDSSSKYTDSDDDDFWSEVYTNATAVLAANATPYFANNNNDIRDKALQFLQEQHQPNDTEFPFDLAYNIASLDVLSANTPNQRQQAITLLQQALKACKQQHEDDDDSTIQQELQPINVNLLWAKTFWGQVAPGATTIKAADTKQLNAVLQNQINPVLNLQEGAGSQKSTDKAMLTLQLLLQGITTTKLTPTQKRLCRYNLAVLQLQSKQYEKCQETLAVLSQSLGSQSKKAKSTTSTVIPTPTPDDTLWWQARADVLLAYALSYRMKEEANNSKLEKQYQDTLQKLQSHLTKAQQKDINDSIAFYLTLHLEQLQQEGTNEDSFDSLVSLSNKNYPAVTASLAKAYQDRNQPDKAEELLLKGAAGNHMVAEMAMAQENYEKAIQLYREALQSADPEKQQVIRARLVEALSHVDPKQAMEEWKKVDFDWEDDEEEEEEESGESLELRELPRTKHTNDITAGTTTATATGKNKKSKESVARKRAKQREAYLAQLQEKGLYNPARPVQPDPERWIPKHERQRRRRRGNNNKSSQGGVSAKEAAKLDVAARVAGADTGSSGPSTAHLTVAGDYKKGGRRR